MGMEIVIRNEEDAWKWFEKALTEDPQLKGPVSLRFEGWPMVKLHYRGGDFNSSVPTRIMPPLLDAQKEVHRLYCQLRYGRQNLKKLKEDERDRLELVIRVSPGSSDLQSDLSGALNEVVRSAVANMESEHLLYAVLAVALTWGSTVAWKEWLRSRAEEHDVESRVRMSELEKEKLALLVRAGERQPAIKELASGIDDFRNDSLHKLKPADSMDIPGVGVNVDGEYAAEITYRPREQSVETRIDGEFVIQSVSSGETRGYKLKVKRLLDGKVINVVIPDGALTHAQMDVLKNNEWAKKPFVMEINAKVLRGEVSSATLVSAADLSR